MKFEIVVWIDRLVNIFELNNLWYDILEADLMFYYSRCEIKEFAS